MNIKEVIRVSLNSIRANMLRSILTMLGIIIGVAAVIAIMAIGKGSTASITSQISSMGNNLLMIYPFAPYDESNPGYSFSQMSSFSMEDIKAIERKDSIADVAPSATTGANVTWSRQSLSGNIEGTTGAFYKVKKLNLAMGRSFNNYETDNRMNVAVLGYEAARSLFAGDVSKSVGETIMIKQLPFKVVGVLANQSEANMMGSNSSQQIYVPLTTAMDRLGQMNIQEVNVSAKSPEDIDQAKEDIRQVLRARHEVKPSEGDNFQINTQKEILETVSGVDNIMNTLLLGIAVISLVVGGIGIMNIMMVSVTERTREIGIRKAIGAQRIDIMVQFLAEAVFLSLLGGVAGVLVGIGASKALDKFLQMPVVITMDPILYSFLSCMAVGVIFGVYPALKASKLKPIDALRYE